MNILNPVKNNNRLQLLFTFTLLCVFLFSAITICSVVGNRELFAIDDTSTSQDDVRGQLQYVIDNSPSGDNSNRQYTTDSWTQYSLTRQSAMAILSNSSATDNDIAEAKYNLEQAISALVDISSLAECIDRYYGLTNGGAYTASSWQGFSTALSTAQSVYADNDATLLEVNGAITTLDNAYRNLVDLTGLKMNIFKANQYKDSELMYTPNSWSEYLVALTIANNTVLLDNATQSQINSASVALANAINNLLQRADFSLLNRTITYAPLGNNSDARYSVNSWNAYSVVLVNAKLVATNPNATQAEVDSARQTLGLAISNLVNLVDLRSVILSYSNVSNANGDYTDYTWQIFNDAYEVATVRLADPGVTQLEVDNAKASLQSSYQGLVIITTLKAGLARSALITDANVYTTSTWNTLQSAVNWANTVLASSNPSQVVVNSAYTILDSAINSLQKRADKTPLTNAINKVASYLEEDYTSTSYAKLQSTLSQAQVVLDNIDAVEYDVNNAITKIESAINNLVNISILRSNILTARAFSVSEYTSNSWENLRNALSTAEQVLINSSATKEQVANANTALESAMGALEHRADKTQLNQLVNTASQYNQSLFTAQSWQNLLDAINVANKLLLDSNATQASVDDATTSLDNAIKSLIYVLSDLAIAKQNLYETIIKIDNLNESDFTQLSWSKLQQAKEQATIAYEASDSTVDEITAINAALNSQINALVDVADGAQNTPSPAFWVILSLVIVLMLCAVMVAVLASKKNRTIKKIADR